MSQITTNLIELKKQYDAASPLPIGGFAPRTGKYLIQSINYLSVGEHENVPVASALWNPNLDELENGLPVQIQLISLMLPQAIGPVVLRHEEFLGKRIEINYGMVKELNDENSSYRIYVVNWRFI